MNEKKAEAGGAERTSAQQKPLIEELEGYNAPQSIHTVNRDGDLYYIECPECRSLDLTTLRLFGCRDCHTRFNLYLEDGHTSFRVDSPHGHISNHGEELTLAQLEKDSYFHKIILGRNKERFEALRKERPGIKKTVLSRDLHKGKDAHGHGPYKKYLLIPIQ